MNAPILEPVEDVTVAGRPSCRVFRAGGGAPLVYFHGVAGVSEDDPVLSALGAHRSVVAPLAPGFADLAELADIDDVHDLALFYDDLLDALGISAATVVGHSFGGMMAAELAAHCPDRVSRLVLAAPFGLWDDAHPVSDVFAYPVTRIGDVLWADGANPAAQAMAAAIAKQGDPEQAVERMISVLQGFSAVAKFVWPVPDKGLRKRLSRIRAKTLVVWGSHDRAVPVWYAQRFADAIAGARVEIVDGAAHMLPVEDPDRFAALVTRFLDD